MVCVCVRVSEAAVIKISFFLSPPGINASVFCFRYLVQRSNSDFSKNNIERRRRWREDPETTTTTAKQSTSRCLYLMSPSTLVASVSFRKGKSAFLLKQPLTPTHSTIRNKLFFSSSLFLLQISNAELMLRIGRRKR